MSVSVEALLNDRAGRSLELLSEDYDEQASEAARASKTALNRKRSFRESDAD